MLDFLNKIISAYTGEEHRLSVEGIWT